MELQICVTVSDNKHLWIADSKIYILSISKFSQKLNLTVFLDEIRVSQKHLQRSGACRGVQNIII